jgi:hypothetical protein
MVDEITDEDIKRVLIDRDITTFKQAFFLQDYMWRNSQ